MNGLLEQRWLAIASHGAALWGRCAQHSPHRRDYAPEAAPQAEACSPRQTFGPEITLLKVCARAAIYSTVASGYVQPLLHKAGLGLLHLVAPRGSLALHSPYPHPRQGQDNEREWGPAFYTISIQEHFEK